MGYFTTVGIEKEIKGILKLSEKLKVKSNLHTVDVDKELNKCKEK